MSYVMIAAAVIGTGLQIGGKLGKNKDAQTAGGLVGLLGAAYGGMSGMGGGTPAIPSGMASSGGMASGVGQAGQSGGLMSMFGGGASGGMGSSDGLMRELPSILKIGGTTPRLNPSPPRSSPAPTASVEQPSQAPRFRFPDTPLVGPSPSQTSYLDQFNGDDINELMRLMLEKRGYRDGLE